MLKFFSKCFHFLRFNENDEYLREKSKVSLYLNKAISPTYSTDSTDSDSSLSSTSSLKFLEFNHKNPSFGYLAEGGILRRSDSKQKLTDVSSGGTDAKVLHFEDKVRKVETGLSGAELLKYAISLKNSDQFFTSEQLAQLNKISPKIFDLGFATHDQYSFNPKPEQFLTCFRSTIGAIAYVDMQLLPGVDGLDYIVKESHEKLVFSARTLAHVFLDNLALIKENPSTIRSTQITFLENCLLTYRSPQKWDETCQKLFNFGYDSITVSPAQMRVVTGMSIHTQLYSSPIEELNDIFQCLIGDMATEDNQPFIGYWMNGDANITNIKFYDDPSLFERKLDVKIFDGKPVEKADWLYDISRCLFSLFGGALVIKNDFNFKNKESLKSLEKLTFLKIFLNELRSSTLLNSYDPQWERRATFFAISQFVRDCRVAFNKMDQNVDSVESETNRITLNMQFAAALIYKFKHDYVLNPV